MYFFSTAIFLKTNGNIKIQILYHIYNDIRLFPWY